MNTDILSNIISFVQRQDISQSRGVSTLWLASLDKINDEIDDYLHDTYGIGRIGDLLEQAVQDNDTYIIERIMSSYTRYLPVNWNFYIPIIQSNEMLDIFLRYVPNMEECFLPDNPDATLEEAIRTLDINRVMEIVEENPDIRVTAERQPRYVERIHSGQIHPLIYLHDKGLYQNEMFDAVRNNTIPRGYIEPMMMADLALYYGSDVPLRHILSSGSVSKIGYYNDVYDIFRPLLSDNNIKNRFLLELKNIPMILSVCQDGYLQRFIYQISDIPGLREYILFMALTRGWLNIIDKEYKSTDSIGSILDKAIPSSCL